MATKVINEIRFGVAEGRGQPGVWLDKSVSEGPLVGD